MHYPVHMFTAKMQSTSPTRREFIRKSLLAGAGVLLLRPGAHCIVPENPNIRLSLAEWSFHRALEAGKLDHLDFPGKAKNFGISAVEYVNGFFGGSKKSFK